MNQRGGGFLDGSAGYTLSQSKASKSTSKKVDWVQRSGDLTLGTLKLAVAVAGTGTILEAKAKALPSSPNAWTKSKPDRKAAMGETIDKKKFWAASFVGALQIDTS